MMGIQFGEFKHNVLQNTDRLAKRGYKPEEGPAPDHVYIGKTLVDGIHAQIRIQFFAPPLQQFNVWLFRTRSPEYSGNEEHYQPLIMPLYSLMYIYFKVEIFPRGKVVWEFADRQSLLEELRHAQTLLLDYGIGWLEDPTSDMEWVRQEK